MSQQPEALTLRLADAIDHRRDWYDFDPSAWCPQAATELRRLHAVESGAKVELMRRDNLIDSLRGLCESYRTQVESLQVEVNEQARLNGMGAERELALMAKVEILQAASVEWSPAYTRGPARQSAPVAAVPAMVPLHSDAIGELAEKYAYRDFTNDYPQTIDDLVRDVEARHGIGPTVGDGAQPIKDTP